MIKHTFWLQTFPLSRTLKNNTFYMHKFSCYTHTCSNVHHTSQTLNLILPWTPFPVFSCYLNEKGIFAWNTHKTVLYISFWSFEHCTLLETVIFCVICKALSLKFKVWHCRQRVSFLILVLLSLLISLRMKNNGKNLSGHQYSLRTYFWLCLFRSHSQTLSWNTKNKQFMITNIHTSLSSSSVQADNCLTQHASLCTSFANSLYFLVLMLPFLWL